MATCSLTFATSFCFLLLLLVWESNAVMIQTNLGNITGVVEDGLIKFRGIPYAEAPVHDLRWKPPQKVTSWGKEGLNATNFKACCPQDNYSPSSSPYITVPISEDCLQLNVYTPSITGALPVMVYIHGGSFKSGWGGDAVFWGDYIANKTEDTLLVTINYRLGALGFLVTEEISGNFGFLDQQLALTWVQENIQSFGGNPNEVTLFGQSAGAMSVTLHTLSPSSNGLFKRAISESNPMGINYRTPEQSHTYAKELADNLDCHVNDLSCLYSQSWEDIVAAQAKTKSFFYPLNTTVVMSFYPVIDGSIIPQQPLDMIKSELFNPSVESIVYGSNRNDSMTFTPNGFISKEEFDGIVLIFFGPVGSQKVLREYPPISGQDNFNLLTILGTDWLFDCPNRLAARSFGASKPSFLYHFMHVSSNSPFNSAHIACERAVCHSDELVYVFHSSSFVNSTFTNEEKELSFNMLSYWTNFAHANVNGPHDLPNWPQYSPATNESLALDVPISVISNYNQEKCDFWDSMGYYN